MYTRFRPLSSPQTSVGQSVTGLAVMLFFFSIFNGIVGYVVPIAMEVKGFSHSSMGFLYATSSIAGALFDLVMGTVLKSTHYRRMFFIMFAVAFLFPIVLWKADGALMFILAMALWGLYYDFFMYGRFDFSSRLPHQEHAPAWGIMNLTQSLGSVIAPLITGFLIVEGLGKQPFIWSLGFLICSFVIFLIVLKTSNMGGGQNVLKRHNKPKISYSLLKRWVKLGSSLYPVLTLTFLMNVLDSFFWIIGPLIASSMSGVGKAEGLFLSLYYVPALFVGRWLRKATERFGKKRVAFVSFSLGSLILVSFAAFAHSTVLLLLAVFVASTFFAFSTPAINGAYADYISESPEQEKDIQAIEDFSSNVGYIIGPVLAGLLSYWLNNESAFVVIGIVGFITGLVLLKITPRSIRL